jgi:hypothetical protein
MAKPSTPRPLEIPYFGTGFYSYRSQLFAPFRSIGINVVSYHDAVLEGADMELTDLSEWQQRPGFTQYCNEPLAEGEIINQFYSARALNGTLLTMFDSNQRLATFNTDITTTLFTKTTTNQGYINQVGDTTYFYDGVDAIRYDQIYGLSPNGIAAPTNTLTVSSTGGWLPNTFYAGASVLLDYNGNIEYAANVSSAGTSLLQDNSSSNHTVDGSLWQTVGGADQWRTTGGATTGSTLTPLSAFVTTGFGFNVPTNAQILGVQVLFGTIAESPTPAYVAGVSLWSAGAALGTAKDPVTQFIPSYLNLSYGVGTDTWGATLTPAIVNDPSFGFAISAQLYNTRVFLDAPYSMRVYYFIPSGESGTAGISGSQLPTWSALPGSYTSDGTLRWNNLGTIGQWLPGVAYPIPSVILDSNNNLQSVEVVTAVEQYNPATTYSQGDVVMYAGLYWTFQNPTPTAGIVPNAALYQSTVSGGSTTYVYNWIQTPNPQTSGATVPVWNTVKGGTTDDGSLVWTNIGAGNVLVNAGYSYGVCYRTMDGHLSTMSNPTLNTGPLLGGSPLAESNISSFSITSDVVTFVADQTYTTGELVYVQGMLTGTYLNDQVFTVITGVPSASYPITNVVVSGGVATFTSVNTLTAGLQVTISGLSSDVLLNGLTLTVLSSGLSGTQFECNVTVADFPSTADNGTAVVVAYFTAAFTHANVASTADTGTVSPVIGQLTSTGIVDARLNYSATITNVQVSGNLVTMACTNTFFPGNTIYVSGLGSASFLNDFTLLIVTATPTQITAYFTNPDYPATGDNGLATFCGIEIYRTADGGGIWYQVGALVNPGVSSWTWTDVYPDTVLNEQLVAPIAHLNDPPPGQLGSIASPFAGGTLCAYWQGRQWLVQGQYLYFDAGADCLNGDPHQSWPPGNRFEYPGTIIGIAATNNGLVVMGADYFGVALGGPQTLTFYPLVISKNFGISSPNCLYQDGQTLHVLSTQGQLWALSDAGEKELEGHYVSDFIADNFPPSSSYVTLHRNGNDVGLFIGNGSSTLLRYGTNIGAWSVPYYPVGGVQAMASIETSIGTYSLCVAPATAGGVIMTRNLQSWADYGGEYTSTYSPNGVGITVGSITLSNPGEGLSPVSHIIGYFDAAGVYGTDRPAISILPNEISATNSMGFITLPDDQAVPEPPIGTIPSTSLQQLRWPIKMWNSQASQFMHHLQIQIIFNSTNAAHTIKALAIKFDEDGN